MLAITPYPLLCCGCSEGFGFGLQEFRLSSVSAFALTNNREGNILLVAVKLFGMWQVACAYKDLLV
jgi:hypothetical protein